MKILLFFLLILPKSTFSSDWSLVDDIAPKKVEAIECSDSNDCFFVTEIDSHESHWRLYTSKDLGNTWNLKYKSKSYFEQDKEDGYPITSLSDGVSPITGYYFITSDYYPVIVKSIDSGFTFKKIILDTSGFGYDWGLWELAMDDTNFGFVDNSYFHYTTTNGWETFEKYPKLRDDQTYYSPVFMDSNTVVMTYVANTNWNGGKGMAFVKYHINEDKWDTLSYFERDSGVYLDAITNIYFINDSLGFGCGWRGDTSLQDNHYYDIIYKTIDGGNNWKLIHKEYVFPQIGFYNNISFADEKNGIAVGFYGKIAMTNDGGDTWVYEPLPNPMEDARQMLVTWAGHYPIIGTWDAGIFRYEGDFFKFPPDTTDVEERTIEKDISIFPNPVTDFLFLSKTNKSDKIEIFSALGIKVLESEYQYKIDVSSLRPGFYFVKVANQVIKIVKY